MPSLPPGIREVDVDRLHASVCQEAADHQRRIARHHLGVAQAAADATPSSEPGVARSQFDAEVVAVGVSGGGSSQKKAFAASHFQFNRC